MPKRQTSFNPGWTKEHKFISKSSRDAFHGFCTLCVSVKCVFIYILYSLFVYLCICIISRSPEIVCFLALCQIICLFVYLFYFQKSRNVMFSGTVPDYLFIHVFFFFPEVQKCYVFRHCALCKTGSSQWSVFETDITMSWIRTNTVNTFCLFCYTYVYIKIYCRSNCLAMNRVGYFRITVSWYHRYDGQNCIVVASTLGSYAIILASLNAAKCPPFWCYGNGHPSWLSIWVISSATI